MEEAGTGAEAIAAVQRRPFDLVLLDVNMPGMSGVEVCRQIRAIAPRTGIVMVTVRDAEEDKIRALDAGADDYVTKPFRFRELIARVRAVLRRLHAETSAERNILQAGDLKIDLEHRLVWKGERGNPSLAQGVRPAFVPVEEPGRSFDAHEAFARGVGSGIRERTGIPAHVCTHAAKEDRGRSGQASIHSDGSVGRLSISKSVRGRRRRSFRRRIKHYGHFTRICEVQPRYAAVKQGGAASRYSVRRRWASREDSHERVGFRQEASTRCASTSCGRRFATIK